MTTSATDDTLICSECRKTFPRPDDLRDDHTMVACPHCATLQPVRLASDATGLPPHAGMVKPSYRKNP